MEGSHPPALILGTEETSALPIIWSLAHQGVPVSVGSSRRLSAGTFSRYPREKLIYPDPLGGEDRFVHWLVDQLKTKEYAVTIGCGWLITYLLSKYKKHFEEYTNVPVVDYDLYMNCRDKSRTMKLANQCGVPIPRTWFPEEDGIETVAAEASYPAVLKPCISIGARGFSYPESPDELISRYRETKATYGPCIVQEFIPHTGMQYKAEILLTKKQEVKLAGSYAKLRFYPPGGGSSALNKTVHHNQVIQFARQILVHMKWWGMGDCDFIFDPRDNIPKLMEINPRFTRTIRILIEAGLDYPYQLYRMALGWEPEEKTDYRENLYMRYLPADISWFLRSQNRFRAKPSFFKFFSGDLIYEEWSFHDPLTGIGLWLLLLGDMLNPMTLKDRLHRRVSSAKVAGDSVTMVGG